MQHKYLLSEREIPTSWYNVIPDLPAPMQISTDLPPRSVLTAPGAVSDPAAAAAMEAHARALAAPPAELSDEWAGRFAWRRGDAGD